MRTLIGVAGRIASGKSDLAQNLAKGLDSRFVSFGDYCRKMSQIALGREDRPLLQQMGRTLVQYPDSFSKKVLEEANISNEPTLVVEGIRHIDVWTSLRELYSPDQAQLIYLDVPEEEIRRRLRAEAIPEGEIDELEEDETETDLITEIPEIADFRYPWAPGQTLESISSNLLKTLHDLPQLKTDLGQRILDDTDHWQRYHQLVSLALRRKLTERETREFMAFEAHAKEADWEEFVRLRDQLSHAKENHEANLASIIRLTDALEIWLDTYEVP